MCTFRSRRARLGRPQRRRVDGRRPGAGSHVSVATVEARRVGDRPRAGTRASFAERRYITAAGPRHRRADNPVWLMHTTGHYGVANGYALKLPEVTNATTPPPAGTIDRDAQGNRHRRDEGIGDDAGRAQLVRRSPAQQQRAGADPDRRGLQQGRDDRREGSRHQTPLNWELYQELLKEGKLTVRAVRVVVGRRRLGRRRQVLARVNANPGPPASLGDGVLLVRRRQDVHGRQRRRATAWMHDDWNKNSTEKDTGNTGYPAMPPEVYRQIVTALHDAGVHVSTHAIGDRAIDWVVDTYAAALARRRRAACATASSTPTRRPTTPST